MRKQLLAGRLHSVLRPEGYKTIQGSEDIVSAAQTQYSSFRNSLAPDAKNSNPIYLAPEPKLFTLGITFCPCQWQIIAGRLAQDSLESERDLEVACFCARHAAGGMPNWVMNQRVKELAME